MGSLEDNPGYGCGGPANENAICDCLSCAIERIASATESIAVSLADKAEDACGNIDKCTDKILENIKKKIEGPLYSCEKCKSMVEGGMAGTLEYAVRCAGVACNDCVDSCESEGEPINEGKCCNNCQGENCTCRGGTCSPDEQTEPKKDKKFVGWCHLETGIVAVTREGDPPPGSGFSQVSIAYTELVAFEEAKSNCADRAKEGPPKPDIPLVSGSHTGCDINGFFNGSAANELNASAVSANLANASTQLWSRVGSAGLEGVNLGILGEVLAALWQGYTGADPLIARDITPALTAGMGCNLPQFQESLKALCSISNASKYIGFDPTPWLTPHYYAMNAVCRQKHLSPDEAMSAFLADNTGQFPLDQHFAIHGLCKEAMNWKKQSARSKPIPMQLAIARRRELITPLQYAQGMRELGYIDERNPELLFNLTEQRPPMSEIIRYMVRDVDDTALVEKFNLDAKFTDKFQQQLKDWARDQGITEKQAKYSWRAHWTIPSPTALFTFWHRLRYNQKFGGKDKLLQDIKDALIQQDILPYWHEHYLAISFRPMRLVDIRRSFAVGTLSDSELIPSYLDLGYSDDTAAKMAAYTTRLRDKGVLTDKAIRLWLGGSITRAEAVAMLQKDKVPQAVIDDAMRIAEPNFSKSAWSKAFVRGDISKTALSSALSAQGVSSSAIARIIDLLSYSVRTSPIMDDYEIGIIDRNGAAQQMHNDGMAPAIASKMLDRIDHHVNMQFIKACVAGIKRQFTMGEINRTEAQNMLIARGLTVPRANTTVDWWGCELQAGEKEVSKSTLCEWLSRGAITSVQFLDRLDRLGYSNSDASLMLEDCLIAVNAKAAAKAKQLAKENAALQYRTQKALAYSARQEASYLQRLEANQVKAAKLRASREKSLLHAAVTLTPKCECDIYGAKEMVLSERHRLQDQYSLSIDRSLQILNLAASEWDGGDISGFPVIVSALADAAVTAQLDGIAPKLSVNGNSNGST
jgi:hypothetical protein